MKKTQDRSTEKLGAIKGSKTKVLTHPNLSHIYVQKMYLQST